MIDTPAVSVVIPAHNAEPFLREAIDSVFAQEVHLELIVVNDGSTDSTSAIIASYGAQLTHIAQEQRGLGGARNRGIAASRGDWIAFLDADDIWAREKTRLQLEAAARRPELDILFGRCVEFSADETLWPARTEPFPGISASGAMIRRALFEKAGCFEESERIGEFLDWYSRAVQAGAQSLVLDEVLFHRRVHGSNMTRRLRAKRDQYVEVMRDHLRRQRQSARVPPDEAGEEAAL